MRDPARIDRMLELVRDDWKRNPDLRLTQLIVGLVRPQEPCPQVFYFEDDKLIERLREKVPPPETESNG